ncbi:MAG TPA: Wzz/FepE/Etk N-terminal domain-containing protein [Blastocatellia bacterium]|nr:Wzz/FepE/Etk N-terminal domain-containing protein [Blastocatellia bacterium]
MGSFRPRNLADAIQILWRRKLLILFTAAIVLLSAFIIITNIAHTFESRARILVSGQIYDRQANGAQIAAVTEQITSRANLESLINRYDLYAPVTNMDRAAQNLLNEIKIETKLRADANGFPESFTLSYRHTDPAVAQKVVTDMLAIFNQANATLEHQAAGEARAIRAEIAELEARLSQTNQQRAAYAARASAASRAAGNLDRVRNERNAIASTVETLRDREYALQQQIASQKQLIVQQQEIVRNAPPADDGRSSSSYNALVKRKAELEAQIQNYSANFTDKYPKLVQAREQLAEVNQRIAESSANGEGRRASAASPEAQQLRTLQHELSRMETEMEIVQRELSRKMRAAASLPGGAGVPVVVTPSVATPAPVVASAGLANEYGLDGLRERYTALLKREDALKEFQPSISGPGTPFFQTVDQPNLPQSPAAPNRTRLMLFALAMALGAGLVAAVAAEIPRMTVIHDERDVNYFLGSPVVALIPEMLTVAERGQAQNILFKRRLVCLIAGAAAVPVLVLVLNGLRIFQMLGNK